MYLPDCIRRGGVLEIVSRCQGPEHASQLPLPASQELLVVVALDQILPVHGSRYGLSEVAKDCCSGSNLAPRQGVTLDRHVIVGVDRVPVPTGDRRND